MQELTSKQRKHLRGLAQKLDAVILIGKQGVSDSLLKATDEALDSHELIKVKFNDFKEEKRELTEEIAAKTRCHVAGMIGHVAILFRQQADPEKRHIDLP